MVDDATAQREVSTAYGRLADVVRRWEEATGGGLNSMQTRELLRALDHLHFAENAVQSWLVRS